MNRFAVIRELSLAIAKATEGKPRGVVAHLHAAIELMGLDSLAVDDSSAGKRASL